ncbi:MAG: metal-dependent phosphohydrolase [Candidatus Reconcilbacillus cellulovorans]|mgnify:FL=1|uniref:Metal-dependent phosphohydrolase n=1 Tax=Candidatus Reconcilbacillus cellulovorans TaxID=1906605 RepID=A0A2A6DZU4_9BACL|nr:MAG: metal-dependent phosphohydrolase [Candidatus Reconcilbacillus cellulovorans]
MPGWSRWKQNPFIRAALELFLVALLFVSLVDRLVPPSYQLEPGEPSDRTIRAPRQIVDEIATRKAQQEAAEQVQPVYTAVAVRNEQLVDRLFDMLEQINADTGLRPSDKASVYQTEWPKLYNEFVDRTVLALTETGGYSGPLIEEVKKQLKEQAYRIPAHIYFKLPSLTPEDLAVMRPVAIDLAARLNVEQIFDAQSARIRVAELVNQSDLPKSIHREIVQEIVRFAITPNKFYDAAKTEEARQRAREAVKPVTVARGQVLVREGEVVGEDVFEWLKHEGVLKEKTDLRPYAGLLLWVGLLAALLFWAIRIRSVPMDNAQRLMLLLIVGFNLFLMRLVAVVQTPDDPWIAFLAPVATGAMLVAVLLDSALAIAAAVWFAIAASVVFNIGGGALFDFRFGFVALSASLAAVFAVQRAGQRTMVVRAGMLVSLVSAAAVGGLLLLESQQWDAESFNPIRSVLFPLLFAVAGGLLTSVLVVGVLPFFEAVFGMLSPLKLLELSNPNHPLLRKLLTETPGTYHHSVVVGNLAEAAAEAIGANGLLCRVGAFYHDVGKTKRPQYFIENISGGDNPHDRLDPALSKSIIIAHVRDGVEMLKAHRIPKPIRDIAEQHHGTSLLKYFYHKARSNQPHADVDEAEYRYPGPKAQSKEAAIVGIADCVEAATRSLKHPTADEIDRLVRRIVKERLDDGQFNECDLTLRELEIVAQSLKETLLGLFHSRIEYPAESGTAEKTADEATKEGAGAHVVDARVDQPAKRSAGSA